jgi:hypothetical protein
MPEPDDPAPRVQAACADCGKTFRVPDASRTYRCKACGGTVRAGAAPAFDDLAACAACDALNPPESRYCGECGAELDPGPDAGTERAPAGRRGKRVPDEQRRAASDLLRSFKSVRLVGVLFRVFAVVHGLGTIGAVLALRDDAVPLGTGLLRVGISAAVTTFLVAGAVLIRFQPFFWTVAIASLATIDLAFLALQDGISWIVLGVKAAIALVFWAAVVPTVRHRQLVRRWPDLYIAQRIHGTQRSRKIGGRGDDPAGARRVLAEATARGWRTAGVAAAAVVALTALGTWRTVEARPASLESALEQVRAAWRAGDAPGVVALFPAHERAERAALLDAIAAGHGWGARWPALAEPVVRRTGPQHAVVRLDLDPAAAAGLTAPAIGLGLMQRDSGWVLEELLVPLPPVDAELARFAEAWQRGDAAALGQLFGAERRERMQGQLERSVARRGWDAGWPALEGGTLEQSGDRRTEATYALAGGGSVTAHWRFEPDGSWVLSGLELPDR